MRPAAPVTRILSDLFKFTSLAGVHSQAATRAAKALSIETGSSLCAGHDHASTRASRSLSCHKEFRVQPVWARNLAVFGTCRSASIGRKRSGSISTLISRGENARSAYRESPGWCRCTARRYCSRRRRRVHSDQHVIGAHRIAHIGHGAQRLEVADLDDGRQYVRLDHGDLLGEGRLREHVASARPGVGEHARRHDAML